MSKFAKNTTNLTRGPSRAVAETTTYNGAKGYNLDDKSALFMLAVTSMINEDTFYESGKGRDNRMRSLVHSITKTDPSWIQRFVPFLRNEMHMRSASVVVACEYVAAGGPDGRKVIDSACVRADEPAEVLGYWMQNYYGWDEGERANHAPKLPQALRKGLGDAVQRLYTERAVLKWNGNSREIGMGHVLDLVHPKTSGSNPIFQYISDKHHNRPTNIGELNIIQAWHELQGLSQSEKINILNRPDVLRKAGMTWEGLSGWLNGPMNAQAWEAMIEAGMGYMALLRNLRNFEQAGISKTHRGRVIDKLTDPEEVKGSRQFPYRFFSAYKMLNQGGYVNYIPALEEALDLSVNNIPSFSGKTLILTDVSGSMTWGGPSKNSNVSMLEIAALFAAAMNAKNDADLVAFATTSEKVSLGKNSSVLSAVNKISRLSLGGGTQMFTAIQKHYSGQDRIVIMSDMQTSEGNMGNINPKFIHAYDLTGYDATPLKIGSKGRFQYGGYSDKMFSMMKLLENFGNGNWPF